MPNMDKMRTNISKEKKYIETGEKETLFDLKLSWVQEVIFWISEK